MLSVEETKRILKRPDMPDEEAEAIRDNLYGLAEIVIEKYLADSRNLIKKSRNQV